MEAWHRLYPGIIEWVPGSKSGKVLAVNPSTLTVSTGFDDYKAAVANIIPPQRAGAIAVRAGLDQGTGYCAIDPVSFESRVHKGIYVLGDATIAGGAVELLDPRGLSQLPHQRVLASTVAEDQYFHSQRDSRLGAEQETCQTAGTVRLGQWLMVDG